MKGKMAQPQHTRQYRVCEGLWARGAVCQARAAPRRTACFCLVWRRHEERAVPSPRALRMPSLGDSQPCRVESKAGLKAPERRSPTGGLWAAGVREALAEASLGCASGCGVATSKVRHVRQASCSVWVSRPPERPLGPCSPEGCLAVPAALFPHVAPPRRFMVEKPTTQTAPGSPLCSVVSREKRRRLVSQIRWFTGRSGHLRGVTGRSSM